MTTNLSLLGVNVAMAYLLMEIWVYLHMATKRFWQAAIVVRKYSHPEMIPFSDRETMVS